MAMLKYPRIQKNAQRKYYPPYAGLLTVSRVAISTSMLVRIILTYAVFTVCALAFHDNTFAVFELRELLLERTLNLWELFEQLEYASEPLRQRVYLDIAMVQSEINSIIAQLLEHDRSQHP
jgi:hypothetical protein